MIGIDTNILIYARAADSPWQAAAISFLENLASDPDVVIAELVLVEFYLALRNPAIFSPPLEAREAVAECRIFRHHPCWALAENADVMERVWKEAGKDDFARRRIIDARLAFTLQAHGVTEFATANVKDFQDFGFRRVWNPLLDEPNSSKVPPVP
jgi:toxin-antitoxin system PIN domain toxin